MVAPTTSYPASTSKAAATDESTPPDIATRTRSLTAPPPPKAKRGTRNAEQSARSSRCEAGSCEGTRPCCSAFRIPRSTFRSSVQDRSQCPDLFDNLGERADNRLHVLRRVLLAEREPQGGDAVDDRFNGVSIPHDQCP